MLGRRMLLETERGYHVMLPQPDPTLRRPVFLGDQSVFLVPMTHGLRVTSGVEFGGLSCRRIIVVFEIWCRLRTRDAAGRGARDVDLDGFSAVDAGHASNPWRDAGAEGVFFATGGSHIGMTLGPIMGKVTADLVAGRDRGSI